VPQKKASYVPRLTEWCRNGCVFFYDCLCVQRELQARGRKEAADKAQEVLSAKEDGVRKYTIVTADGSPLIYARTTRADADKKARRLSRRGFKGCRVELDKPSLAQKR
jgi:hypothetical protein